MKSNAVCCAVLLFIAQAMQIRGDIVIDDFNASRSYPYCCGEYGTYDSFFNSVTQNGGGTMVINAAGIDGGGVYHYGFGTNLWNFQGQTGLVVRAKALTSNTAGYFVIEFQDLRFKRAFFEFPFSSLNTTSFTTLAKEVTLPDFYDDGFDAQHIGSFDIQADYGDFFFPTFGLELDYVMTLAPANSTTPIIISISAGSGTNAVLKWPTNVPAGLVLQYATNLNYPWMNYTGTPSVAGTNYSVTESMLSPARFFQLGNAIIQNGKFHLESGGSSDHEDYGTTWETNNIPKTFQTIFDAPLYTETTIDVSGYTESSAYWRYTWGGSYGVGQEPLFYYGNWTTDYNEHTGGTDRSFSGRKYMTTANGNYPCWGEDCSQWNSNLVTWTKGDTNWPSGWRVGSVNSNCYPSGGTSGAQNPPLDPPRFHVSNLEMGHGIYTNTCSVAATNWRSWSENTSLDMHVAAAPPAPWILLSAWATEAELWWSGESVVPHVTSNDVFPTNILLLGKPLNADGMIFKQFLSASTYPVTPVVIGTANYEYDVSIVPHKTVALTWVYHQRFHAKDQTVPTLNAWQDKYDAGTRVLAADDDTKIRDDDPSVAYSTNAASLYRNDDVPVYVEFVLTNGPTNYCVFTKTFLPVIPNSSNATFQVRFQGDLDYLHSVSGNIKLVKNIQLPHPGGFTEVIIAQIGAIGQKPPSFVVTEVAAGVDLIHEWGHSCGIQHRNLVSAGVNLNPSNNDTNAVMASGINNGANKINRYERDLMNAY